MELHIDGAQEASIEGQVTIEVPSYMELLPPIEFAEARTSGIRNRLVIAAGRDPKTLDLILITGTGAILSYSGYSLEGAVRPVNHGHTLRFTPVKGAPTDFDAGKLISWCKPVLNLFGSNTYPGEAHCPPAETPDPRVRS